MNYLRKILILLVIVSSAISCEPRIELDPGQWGTHADVTSGVFFYQWELDNIVLAEGEVVGAKVVDVTDGSEVLIDTKVINTLLKDGTEIDKIASTFYHDGLNVEPLNGAPKPGIVSDYSSNTFVYRVHSADGEYIDWTLNVALKPVLSTYHVNPVTGVDYTAAELADLSYDPLVKESYLVDQPVELALITSVQPTKVEVTDSNDTVLATLSNFTAVGNEFKSENFSTTVTDLGLAEGEKTNIKFVAYFPATSANAVVSYNFQVNYFGASSGAPTGFQLVRQSGNNAYIDLTPNAARDIEIMESDRFGYSYNGSSQYGVVADDGDLDFRRTDDFSIAFWVRTTSTDSDPEMMADQDWGSSNNQGFTIAFRGDNWRTVASDGAGNKADIRTDGTIPFNNGAWHLLAVSFDRDGDMTMYQDGVVVETADMSSVGSMDNGNPINIAQDGTSGYGQFFNGDIADAKIFDYVITPAEVADLAQNPDTGVSLRKASGARQYLMAAPSGGVTLEDLDGRQGWDFDGSSEYATINDGGVLDFRYEEDYSISFWVNTTSTDSDPEMIADQDWSSSNNTGTTIAFRGDNWRAVASDGAGNKADIRTDGSIPFNDGAWHMITATFDRDGNMTMYQDGVEVLNADMSSVGSMNSGNPLRIAQDGTGGYGQFFQGKIAKVVVHDWTISAGEVTELYNE